MKLVRFLTEGNQVMHGVYNPDSPGWAQIIQGDVLGNFKVLSGSAKIKRLLAPINPTNILALGLNYRRHADETKISHPEIPVLFIKATSSVIGPNEPILLPSVGPEKVDYEAELAVIIAEKVKNISARDAANCILGYTCANDISARDWQIEKQKKQWARGKSFDTFCPLGPYIVTRDELNNPQNLRIRAILNNHILQDSSTGDMIFSVPEIISHLSQSMTLLPGTVILTGTPEGVGFTRQPPVFLRDGDVVTIEIEKIGQLTNPIKREA
jgi:2-keto-4-pentenoate hydratase/2-oxohepta-3-ene-1,7-dioic acid hydratase in catechol pathway